MLPSVSVRLYIWRYVARDLSSCCGGASDRVIASSIGSLWSARRHGRTPGVDDGSYPAIYRTYRDGPLWHRGRYGEPDGSVIVSLVIDQVDAREPMLDDYNLVYKVAEEIGTCFEAENIETDAIM